MPKGPHKPIRLQGYDYSQEGLYFVTICTHKRACIFGDIVNEQMKLSTLGVLVEKYWQEIPQHFPNVVVDIHQVMPNHFHGIIQIVQRNETIEEDWVVEAFSKPIAGSLSRIIGSFKAAVTRKARNEHLWDDKKLWQPRFFDKIVRNESMLAGIREYIVANPASWDDDELNPDNL